MSDLNEQILRKKNALLKLLSKEPTNKQLLELCRQWNVIPVNYAGMAMNRSATIAKLCSYVLSL